MKACIIQPPYSRDVSYSDEYFDYKLKKLDECDDTVDIIVLPEYSDVPCATTGVEDTVYYHNKYIDILLISALKQQKDVVQLFLLMHYLMLVVITETQHMHITEKENL